MMRLLFEFYLSTDIDNIMIFSPMMVQQLPKFFALVQQVHLPLVLVGKTALVTIQAL